LQSFLIGLPQASPLERIRKNRMLRAPGGGRRM
jgi:hypothetical protein